MHDARERLALLANPSRSLEPGRYRAYLAPTAMEELASMLCWGGFSGRALATRQSCLFRMQDGATALSPAIAFTENIADGIAPAFQDEGFARPDHVPLLAEGRLVGSLVSPRTAKEFALETNGANAAEMPEALDMAAGKLALADTLAALDTGIYVGNLWYLNFSDRPACRVTGMTRFASFWVEHGKIVAPVNVMRFDDSVYRLLGDHLVGLTDGARTHRQQRHLSRPQRRQHAVAGSGGQRDGVYALTGCCTAAAEPISCHSRRMRESSRTFDVRSGCRHLAPRSTLLATLSNTCNGMRASKAVQSLPWCQPFGIADNNFCVYGSRGFR